MARLWGALQSTITEAYKTANDLAQAKWKEITCTVIDEGETTERRLLDVNVRGDLLEALKDVDGLVPGMVGYVGPVVQTANGTVTTIVDNATIEATVTSASIDFSKYQHFDITYKLGAGVGGTPTLVITVVEIDSNGNEITDSDYTSAALAASSSGHIKGYFESYNTLKVRCTLGGTGTLAASTIEINMK